jgi:DNA-3-methyladenine glycosylase II
LKKTGQKDTFVLRPRPPYDFDLTAGYITHFRGRYGADTFEDGVFRRLLNVGGLLALATVRSTGTVEAPELDVQVGGFGLDDSTVDEARRQTAWMLGAEQDLKPFYRMASDDGLLAPIVRRLHGLHVPRTVSVFEGLVLAILGQQISAGVARMLRTTLIRTYGPVIDVDGETYHAFPHPGVLAETGAEGLRKIKFGARKAEYIADISSLVASGDLDLERLRGLPSDEAVRLLTEVRGIGLWTANWLLIQSLGHDDGFPHGDLALQRTVGLLANEGTRMPPQAVLDYSERWRPYRSYATTYLFAAARSGVLDRAG